MEPYIIVFGVIVCVGVGIAAYTYFTSEENTEKPLTTNRSRRSSQSSNRSDLVCYDEIKNKREDSSTIPRRRASSNNSFKGSSNSTPIHPKTINNKQEDSPTIPQHRPSSNNSFKSSSYSTSIHPKTIINHKREDSPTIPRRRASSNNSFTSSSNSTPIHPKTSYQNSSEIQNSHTTTQHNMFHENSIQGSSNSSHKSTEDCCMVCDQIANARFLPCEHIVFCSDCANYYLDSSKNYETRKVKAKCPHDNCHKLIEKII